LTQVLKFQCGWGEGAGGREIRIRGQLHVFPSFSMGFAFKKTFIPPLTDGHPNQVQTEVCFKIAWAKSQN
jgi:hypothetical protein